MSKVLQLGLLDSHLANLRAGYRAKLSAMLEAADEHLSPLPELSWKRPDGGLYVWLELPKNIDAGPAGPLFDAALAEGVMYVPGEYCYAGEGVPAERNRIRLSFGVQPADRIRDGIAALARAISSLPS
jgi:2-aminoadipate transaminase